jgi:hypothetical protein
MSDEQDWRLTCQANYLQGVAIRRAVYKRPSEAWDHDHCEFCWAKFSEHDYQDEPTLHVGYVANEGLHWICDRCFRDFRERFQWRVLEEADP